MTSRPKHSGTITHGHIVILALLFTAWAFPQCGVSAEPNVSDYQEIHEGELPIILESPHGGMKEIPITRPNPPIGGYDKYTLELTQLIRERMIERTGKSPEMVAMLANRAFIDVNRGAGTNAYRHVFTKQLYEAHYAAIDAAVTRVKMRSGKGLMVLIHSGWRYPVQIAIGVNHVKERCTVPWFVQRYGWEEFHGTNGVGGRLFAQGYQVPGFGGAVGPDFVGVPALTRCRMKENFGIDGLEFEFQGGTLLRDEQRRKQLANDVADTLLDFVNEYYTAIPIKKEPSVELAVGKIAINEFTYAGSKEDRVGYKSAAKPDGTVDAHFVLSLRVGTNVNIQCITVSAEGPSTKWWSTGSSKVWLAGAFRGDTQINNTYVDTLGLYSGNVTFDLFLNNASALTPGRVVTVTVIPEGGKPAQRTWTMAQE